jgi:hypothetical protein
MIILKCTIKILSKRVWVGYISLRTGLLLTRVSLKFGRFIDDQIKHWLLKRDSVSCSGLISSLD